MWQVYGQDHVLRQLEPGLKQGRQAHAYLLSGPPHVGKMTLALNLAQGVNCLNGPGEPCGDCVQCARISMGQHADVQVVGLTQGDPGSSTRTVIGIADVKEALRRVHLKPFEGTTNVIIFDSGELMSEEAANVLLKTLEEPPPQVLILLLTADEEAILPTIRSRCRRLPLLPMAKDQLTGVLTTQHQASPEDAELVSRLSRGCLGWAIGALEPGSSGLGERDDRLAKVMETCQAGLDDRFNHAGELAGIFYKDRQLARQWLYLWLRWWRDLLLIKEGGEAYIHNTDRETELRLQAARLGTAEIVAFVRKLLETLESLDRNASARLALEVLMLDLPVTAASA